MLILTALTFLGELVHASDLVCGTSYDSNLYWDTLNTHPRLPHERHIGDGHFGSASGVDIPIAANHVLTNNEKVYNDMIQLVRSLSSISTLS